MHPRHLAAVAAILMLAPSAAVAQAAPAADSTAPMPTIALPAPLDRVLRDYERAWRAGDAAALAALFSADGFVLQNGRPPVRGRAAIAASYAGQSGPLHLRALAYAAQDSVAFIIGAFGYPRPDAAPGAPVSDGGKFTLTLKRGADGRWLIFSDMDNSNRRPQRPTGGAAPASSPASSPVSSPPASP